MSFDYREAVDLKSLARFSVTELRDHVRHALTGGWRVLAFFGIPEEKTVNEQCNAGIGPTRPLPVSLCCILAHDGTRRLMARCTSPVTAFMSLTPDLPQLHYFEREIYEQWGVEPLGHPWLKSVRRTPDSFEAQTRPAAATSDANIPGANVSGTDVSGVDVSGVDVSGVDVSGADASGANTLGAGSAVSPEAASAAVPAEKAAPTSLAQPYPFYRVEGVDVHEVAVGPVHAGIIEPGHFRFQCYGENVLHLEIALGY